MTIANQHESYFVQKVQVSDELVGIPRIQVMSQICANLRVLHVGCVDFPITNIENNLHIKLDSVCSKLDGFDVNSDVFPELKRYLKGGLYDDWSQVKDSYDIVLVPEVLEHVDNVADFLGKLDSLDANSYVITVPDAYQCYARHFEFNKAAQEFVEIVHPDHNCWYTPYTLKNTITKYTNWKIQGIWFYNNISLLLIATKG